jgi:hypothetical protein
MNQENKLENPYNCHGRKPHPMDFDGKEYEEDPWVFEHRLSLWEKWEKSHNVGEVIKLSVNVRGSDTMDQVVVKIMEALKDDNTWVVVSPEEQKINHSADDIYGYPQWLIEKGYFNYKSFDESMRKTVFAEYLKTLHPATTVTQEQGDRTAATTPPSAKELLNTYHPFSRDFKGREDLYNESTVISAITEALSYATTPPPPKATTVTQEQDAEFFKWLDEKPVFNFECLVIAANEFRGGWHYMAFRIEKVDSEEGWYWGWLDGDGEEYGDLSDFDAEKYFLMPLLKQAPNPELSVATEDAQGVDAGNQKTPPPVRCEQQEGDAIIECHCTGTNTMMGCNNNCTKREGREFVKELIANSSPATPPAPPQQEGINIEQLETDFVDWYFTIKYETGQQPLAMQIMYWFKQRLLTTPSPSNGAIFNASEIQRLLTEQQNKH